MRANVERKLALPNVVEQQRCIIDKGRPFYDHAATTLYDVGCSVGAAMMAARDLGLTAEGHDVNKVSVKMLRNMGFNARLGFTQEMRLKSKAYDILTNLDRLQGSYEPMEDLETCRRILRDGGVLCLRNPYLGSPEHLEKADESKLFGRGRFHYFEPNILRTMVKRVGLRVLETTFGRHATIITAC